MKRNYSKNEPLLNFPAFRSLRRLPLLGLLGFLVQLVRDFLCGAKLWVLSSVAL